MIMDSSQEFESLMKFLPSLNSKSVLEIGASSLGLTGILLENNLAKLKIVASEQANLNNNNDLHKSNKIEFVAVNNEDSRRKFRLYEKFDFVFINENLSNFSDEEFLEIIETSLLHLHEDEGYLFFIGSSQKQDKHPRIPISYIDLVQMKVTSDESANSTHGFELVFAKPSSIVSTTCSSEYYFSHTYFVFEKKKLTNHHGFKSLQEFMDHKQYTRNGVIRYERIFGDGFVSTGGIETTTKFLAELNLKPGMKVLDVGCGIGGGDFLMSEKYGVEVLGIDLSSNMVAIAWERANNRKNLLNKIQFEIGDIMKQKFPDNYFDLVYSRDTILHIDNKPGLFALFKKWLKPGGRVFITDYCCGKKPWSPEFESYVQQRGYDLWTVEEYGKMFTDVGFKSVQATNVTDMFVECLNSELKKMDTIKDEFVREFSLDDFNYLIDGWKAKLVRCSQGHQQWGRFLCEK